MTIKEYFGWILSKVMYEWNPVKRRKQQRFYRQFVGEGDLAFDIGAHMGDRSKIFLNLGARVVGVEPQPRFSSYLQKKFTGDKGYHNEEIGIGATTGKADLMVSSMYPTLSSLAGEQWKKSINAATSLSIDFDKTITVEVRTLDSLVEKYGIPGFIKIDVEGFEAEVLKGLSIKVDKLSFEFLRFNMGIVEECLDILTRLGYTKYNWSVGESFEMQLTEWCDREILEQSITGYKTRGFSGDIYATY